MSDASQSLLERITDALTQLALDSPAGVELMPEQLAASVMGVLGERDAEIRCGLEEAKYHAYTSDRRVTEHIDAALALLGDA